LRLVPNIGGSSELTVTTTPAATISRIGCSSRLGTTFVATFDVGPLEVLSRVTRLARHLDRVRSAAFARHGLEGWEFDVLAALRRSGPPYQLSPGQLVAQTMVTSGTMTNRIDRLAGRLLVRRLPDPDDGRGVMVRLEPAGAKLVDTALADLLAVERDLLESVAAGDRVTLADLLRRLTTRFDQP
jgi:DNA-binding MarR family transcriptional regulator